MFTSERGALDINTDSDMALSSSLSPEVSMAPDDSSGHSDEDGLCSEMAFGHRPRASSRALIAAGAIHINIDPAETKPGP